jgi:hypothetical protein
MYLHHCLVRGGLVSWFSQIERTDRRGRAGHWATAELGGGRSEQNVQQIARLQLALRQRLFDGRRLNNNLSLINGLWCSPHDSRVRS